MIPQPTTLKRHCKNHLTPFYELGFDEARPEIIRKWQSKGELARLHPPYVYCGLAEDVHVFGRSFLYTKENEYIFNCQSYQNYKEFNLVESFQRFIKDRTVAPFTGECFEDECIFLGGMNIEMTPNGPSHLLPGAANFGHFIFEYLNRLPIFDMAGGDDGWSPTDWPTLPVVVYDTVPERYLEWLNLFEIKNIIKVPVENGPWFRRAWIASAPHYRGTDGGFRFWGAGLHWLRYKAFQAISGPKIGARRRVYLGRDDARWRRVTNEDAVKVALTERGFICPQMSTMTPSQQLALISGAEIVVGAAGANTILTHFAPEHATIITCYPANMGLGPWGGLGASCFLRQTYERIDCVATPNPNGSRLNGGGVDELADFTIDIPTLMAKVEAAIKLNAAGVIDDALRL